MSGGCRFCDGTVAENVGLCSDCVASLVEQNSNSLQQLQAKFAELPKGESADNVPQQPLNAIAQLAIKYTSDIKLSAVEGAAVWVFVRWVEQQQ